MRRDPVPALIRDALPADYGAIGQLTAQVYLDGGFAPVSSEPFLRDIAPRVAAGDLLVAVHPPSDTVIGAVTLALAGSRYAPLAGDGQGEVRLLAVSPAARGTGAGTSLMQVLLDRAKERGLGGIVLSTQPSMTAAHRIYERLGFLRVPGRDYRTADGRTMLVYALTLQAH